LPENHNSGVSRLEWLLVFACCTVASQATVLWSWQSGAMLNYGDALAHLHIARRVFDAQLPRVSMLGSVWLPLPHLLMLPFVQVYGWWANGAAALPASVFSYLAGCAGLYRLARRWLSPAPAALALACFALNPNLLYMQTTAMTEPLFVCEMIWLVVWMVEWRSALDVDPEKASRLQGWIALVLVAAIFTRYDGWIMAAIAWTGIGLALLKRGRLRSVSFWVASFFVVAAPIAWFVYNSVCFGDWLEFMRGPYSAKAIEIRTATPGSGPPHPGWHNPWVSLEFFIKAAEMDATAAAVGTFTLIVCGLGTIWAWCTRRRSGFLWALLLWLPMPFYAYSISYGSVPIFLPPWWPHSWYNARYGMELLPALALGLGFAAHLVLALVRDFKPAWGNFAAGFLFVVLGSNAVQMVREHPLVYVEGTKNRQSRLAFEEQIPPVLRVELAKRPGGLVLMDTSVYPSLVALTGIPFRQTINEGDLWIFDAALKAPAEHAALVLAFDGDAVDRAVKAHPEGLVLVGRFDAPGQASGTLYRSKVFDQ
jgi:hypothetical protein